MGWLDSIVATVQNDISNTVSSVADFVAAPAATITEAWVQQRDQETAHQVEQIAPAAAFISGDMSLGAALETGSKAGVNADLALITGTSDNQEEAGIVRNTVVGAAAVVAAAYGGMLAYSGGGLGTAGASLGAAGTVGSMGTVGAAEVGAAGTVGAAAGLTEVGTALTGVTAVVGAGGELAAAVTPPVDPVPVAVPAPQASQMAEMLPYLLAAGVAAKIILF